MVNTKNKKKEEVVEDKIEPPEDVDDDNKSDFSLDLNDIKKTNDKKKTTKPKKVAKKKINVPLIDLSNDDAVADIEKVIKNDKPKPKKKINKKEDEPIDEEKSRLIEIIQRYHDMFGHEHKVEKAFDSFEKMSKKSIAILQNHLTKYQDEINGGGNLLDNKIVDISLAGVQIYETAVTKISKGKINLIQPNKVSDVLKDNPDYSDTVKQLYCMYFPSFKINNPLLKLGCILITTSAVVNQKNKSENPPVVDEKLDEKINGLGKDNVEQKKENKKKTNDELFMEELEKKCISKK